MTRPRRNAGFTLLELVIALSLSTFVLVGVMMLATTMVREQYDSSRGAEIASSSLYALDEMNRHIESATHLATVAQGDGGDYPGTSPNGGSIIAFCENYSPLLGGAISSGDQVRTIIYCIDGQIQGAVPQPNPPDDGNSLWRYKLDGSCSIPPVTCTPTTQSPSAGTWEKLIDAKRGGIWPGDDGNPYFTRTPDGQGVILDYIVGHSTAAVNVPRPAFFKGNYSIYLDRHLDASQPMGSD